MSRDIPAFIFALSASAAVQAQALQPLSLSPQGEAAQVRQVAARFSKAVASFGNPQARAPRVLSCSDAQAAKGSGRWSNQRERIFVFKNDMPPGVRYSVVPDSEFKSVSDAILADAKSYEFNSDWRFIQNLCSGTY